MNDGEFEFSSGSVCPTTLELGFGQQNPESEHVLRSARSDRRPLEIAKMREAAFKALEMKQAVDVCAEYHADEVSISARGRECSCKLKSAMRSTSLT